MDSQEKAVQELIQALKEAPDDKLAMVLLYCANIAVIAEKTRLVESEAELLELVSRRVVDPIVETSHQCESPDELMSFLLEFDEAKITGDFIQTLQASSLEENAKKKILEQFPAYMEQTLDMIERRLDFWYRRFAGAEDGVDRRMSDWLSDIKKFRADGNSNRLDTRKKGFVNSLRGIRKYVRRQVAIADSAREHVKNASDISIWYSRYLLVPAFENAKDGYLSELLNVCREICDDEELLDGCVKFAAEMGFQAERNNFDANRLRSSIRQLCRARTGYNFPMNYLASLIPAAEYENMPRRTGLPVNVE